MTGSRRGGAEFLCFVSCSAFGWDLWYCIARMERAAFKTWDGVRHMVGITIPFK